MSLTSFLRNKDVKARFRQEFKKPKFLAKKDLLAPPLTKRYSLVGTAFDYLLRFYLQHLNPDALARRWVAENSISHPLSPLLTNVVLNADTKKISFTETEQTKKVQRIIKQAKEVHSNYLSSGEMTDVVIETTLLLAQLDPIYRAGFVDPNIGTVHNEDVADLRNLVSIVNPEMFRARELCLLNPTFGEGSKLVGGADVDLVIDDTIIDIKTTKKLEFQRKYFDQLIGYYVLHEIAGVGKLRPKPEIANVAIYFSRHEYLYVLELGEIIDKQTFPDFVRWFKDRAIARKTAS
ncbi:MAG: hypothetical protein FVQ83_14955 [Chloroflexi bacterium]|nr:hypothetical protein [Chloroflexota bacterium]